jgi:cytochrome P450
VIETPHGPLTQDPALYPDPGTFNARRFSDLRAFRTSDPINYKNREQYQFIAVTKENMGFGYGPHACPGRFFAANEIKLILARLLLRYDLRLPDGAKVPPRIVQGSSSQVDPRLPIEFRRVKDSRAAD